LEISLFGFEGDDVPEFIDCGEELKIVVKLGDGLR
jgi:hypothetical protein